LFPTICLDIICRGKQIFFFLENGLAFISGLGMEGHWYYFKSLADQQEYLSKNNYRKLCLHFGKKTNKNGILWCFSETEIWYDDMLSYGNFTITNWAEAFNKMREIGPDLLATTRPFDNIHPVVQKALPSEFFQPATLQLFASAIRSPGRSQMELCRFLMEQKYFSGVGNWVKNEVLYHSRLHPNRVLGSLSDQDIELLFSMCLTILNQGYQYGGVTHGTFLDPDFQKGSYQVAIYKREGQLDSNGYQIKRIATKDGRSSYVVEELQK
jgi:formamidopyrimidine-DNA glycosylase